MQPFRIICETCHARLKVSSASAIGEIHACPKCGSMVRIAPPAEASQAAPHTTNSISISAIEPAVQPSLEDAASVIEFVESTAPPAPASRFSSPLLFWSIGGAAVLVIGGVVAATWRAGGESLTDSPPLSAVASAAVLEAPSPRATEPTDPTDTGAESDSNVVEEGLPEITPTNEAAVPPELPKLPADDTHTDDGEKQLARDAPARQLPPLPDDRADDAPAAEQRRSAPVLKLDPLDFDPSRLSLGSGNVPPPAPFAGSISDEGDGNAALAHERAAEEPAETALAPPAERPTISVRRGPAPSEFSPPENVMGQLAFRVASIDSLQIPLASFIDMVSDIAGAPITLDPIELELAGISPAQAIAVQAKDATLENVVTDVLSKQRLELIERQGRLRMALAGGERRRSVDYEVKDLAGGDAQPLAALIEQFIAPASWQSGGGDGTITVDGTKLRIEGPQRVHHQILIFCERLRLARGLVLRSRYPADLLAIEPPHAPLAGKLNQRTTFTFLPWSRLADVVRHWQDKSGIIILVDWSALADIELTPSSFIACSALDRSWEDALDGILEPLGLAWWAVDGKTIQVTTAEAPQHIGRVEFYTLPAALRDQFASIENLVETLESELLRAYETAGPAGQHPRAAFDEPSGRLIVLATPSAHRYLNRRIDVTMKP